MTWWERHYASVVSARLAMYRGLHADALSLLARLEHDIADTGATLFSAKGLAVRLMAEVHSNALDDAAATLRRLLELGVSAGLRRSFLEEGSLLMTAMARTLRHVGLSNLPARQSTFLAGLFASSGNRGSSEQNQTAEQIFSKREREVHQGLCKGLPSKIIARQLRVSEVTVRFHLSRIYKKLGVNSRSLAIAVSKQRGLFPSN